MKLTEELAEYRSFLTLEKRIAHNSVLAYLSDIREFFDFLATTNTSAPEASSAQIEEYFRSLTPRDLTTTSRARKISSIRSYYNYLIIRDRIEHSPVQNIESPKIQRKIPDTLSHSEIKRLYEAASQSSKKSQLRDFAIIDMLYSTGIRVSELVSITYNDIFAQDGYIRVRGKGNKERLVPIGEQTLYSIEQYRQSLSNEASSTLFLNNRNRPLSREMIFMIIKRLALEAGITKNISPHTLRHTYATELVTAGIDIRLVQDILGHDSITTTEIYTHLDTSHKREVIERNHPLGD